MPFLGRNFAGIGLKVKDVFKGGRQGIRMNVYYY
jgi:hypothetical protein